MKAIFDVVQPPVRAIEDGGKVYVFIAVNGEWTEQKYDENQPAQQVWECDYREIVTDKGKIDLEKVRESPEKFLDWVEPVEKTDLELLRETVDTLILSALEGGESDV